MKKLLLVFVIVFASCNTEKPTKFSKEALNDTLISLNGEKNLFNEILTKYKGKKIVIDIWASWCGDCIKGMPKVVALQEEYKDVVFLFLSLDKTEKEWKAGIKKYSVQGEHYFLASGKEGGLGNFVTIDWIPRYMIINENGTIALFKAVHANDNNIINALK